MHRKINVNEKCIFHNNYLLQYSREIILTFSKFFHLYKINHKHLFWRKAAVENRFTNMPHRNLVKYCNHLNIKHLEIMQMWKIKHSQMHVKLTSCAEMEFTFLYCDQSHHELIIWAKSALHTCLIIAAFCDLIRALRQRSKLHFVWSSCRNQESQSQIIRSRRERQVNESGF